MSGLQLARDAGHVVNPATGELLDLAEASTEQLAEARDALTQLKTEREIAAAQVDGEIVRRTDAGLRSGEITAHTFTIGDYQLSVDSPNVRDYDVTALRKDMLRRSAAGELDLTPEAVESLFIVKSRYARHLQHWGSMLAQLPQLRLLLDEHAIPKRRTVKVQRLPRRHIEGTATEVN